MVTAIDAKYKESVLKIVSQMASKSLRTLIIAYRHFPEDHPVIKKSIHSLRSSKSSRVEADRKENPIFNENPN